jgi:intracellular sulfur oxidation DsrE/DsrF family protein
MNQKSIQRLQCLNKYLFYLSKEKRGPCKISERREGCPHEVGDIVISINSKELVDVTLSDALNLLSSTCNQFEVKVLKPQDYETFIQERKKRKRQVVNLNEAQKNSKNVCNYEQTAKMINRRDPIERKIEWENVEYFWSVAKDRTTFNQRKNR